MGSLIGAISSQKVTFHVALFASDGEASIRLYAGTSVHLRLRGTDDIFMSAMPVTMS
jgi:hypothetical protein